MHIVIQQLLSLVGAVGITALVILLFSSLTAPEISEKNDAAATNTAQGSNVEVEPPSSTPPEVEPEEPPPPKAPPETSVPPPRVPPAIEVPPAENTVRRIQDPYPFSPLSFDVINTEARAALVNILCTTNTQGGVKSTTASGIVIDARGVILTNAHVGQYFLLSENASTNLECVIRHGTPAKALWRAEVLYIPSVWIEEHAKNILEERPTGTGEHDYAFLRIKSALDGSVLPQSFETLIPDTRERIAFLEDPVLTASYPAEFLSGGAASSHFPVSALTTVRELLTFGSGKVDSISLGGIAAAQSGSSGGGVVNVWNRLVGIITTTSVGETTAERDLRAITLSYINRDMTTQSGSDISTLLSGDIAQKAADFGAQKAPDLVRQLLDEIAKR